jgi:hypothetical protein
VVVYIADSDGVEKIGSELHLNVAQERAAGMVPYRSA